MLLARLELPLLAVPVPVGAEPVPVVSLPLPVAWLLALLSLRWLVAPLLPVVGPVDPSEMLFAVEVCPWNSVVLVLPSAPPSSLVEVAFPLEQPTSPPEQATMPTATPSAPNPLPRLRILAPPA